MERGRGHAREWAPALLCGALTLVVTTWQLGHPSYWLDEAATIEVTGRSLPQLFATLMNVDAVHGLYYLIIHLWRHIFGISEVALRLPSALAMSAAAIGLVRLGQRIGTTRMAVIAGLIFAVNGSISFYAEEARPYAMVVALAVWATLALERLLERSTRRRWWCYGVLIVLLGAMNCFALLLVPAHAIRLVLSQRTVTSRHDLPGSAPIRTWLFTVICAGVVISPIPLAAATETGQIDWIPKPKLDDLHQWADLMTGNDILIFVLLPLGALGAWITTRPLRELTLPWLFLPVVVLLTGSFLHPVFVPRYVLFSLPALCLLAAAGLESLTTLRRPNWTWIMRSGAAACVVTIVLFSLQSLRSDHREISKLDDLRAVAGYLSAHERPGDGIYYLRALSRVDSAAYPGPYATLEDVTLMPGGSPLAVRNLLGTDANIGESPAQRAIVAQRLNRLQRVWVQRNRTVNSLLPRDLIALRLLRRLGFVEQSPVYHYQGGSLTLWVRETVMSGSAAP